MFDIPLVGPVLMVVVVFLFLASGGFKSRDGSPPSPEVAPQAALRMCVTSFNVNIPAGTTAVLAPARVVSYPNLTCRVRIDGALTYVMAGGIWMQDLTSKPLAGPPNADVVEGRLRPR